MKIAQYILRYCQQRQPRTSKAFPDYEHCKRVLLLFESDTAEENTSIQQIIKQLQAEGKEVTAWGYADKKNIVTPPTAQFRLLGKKDTYLFRRPRKETIRILQSRSYDLLIDLTLHNTLPTAWLSLLANATFKTGKASGEAPYRYDFMIQTDDTATPLFLFEQIVFYLQNIRTKDGQEDHQKK